MPRPKPTYIPEPRLLNQWQVACRLGKSVQWFINNRKHLEQIGFPKKDAVFGGWDSNAMEAWLDSRAGLDSHTSFEDQMLAAIHDKNHAPVSL